MKKLWILIGVIAIVLVGALIYFYLSIGKPFLPYDYNVEAINDQVHTDIDKLFIGDEKIVLYIPNDKVTLPSGQNWGVAFGLKNTLDGAGRFRYEVDSKGNNCNIPKEKADSFIVVGDEQNIMIEPNKLYYGIIRIVVPKDMERCEIEYELSVMNKDIETPGYNLYASKTFDLNIE